jgi:hypothetical protein
MEILGAWFGKHWIMVRKMLEHGSENSGACLIKIGLAICVLWI